MISMAETNINAEKAKDLINRWAREKKFSDITINAFGQAYLPYYYCESTCTIKRAFRLPPRVIAQKWLFDATQAKIFRIGEVVSDKKGESDAGIVFPYIINSGNAGDKVHEEVLKHALRFYKFFWTPVVQVTKVIPLYLPFWLVRWQEGPGREHYHGINAYSGDVIRIH